MMFKSILQPGVEIQTLRSQIIDQELQLFIKLPLAYETEDASYPVLFCLDGNRNFPLYSTLSLVNETPGFHSQKIIIVGIGYKIDSDRTKGLVEWAAWRTRDLTPECRAEVEQYWEENLSQILGCERVEVQTGGADLFLNALCEEVIPFIEANYHVQSTERGLAGFSYGGLFVLYTLFHATQMFTRYFAGSPTMWKQLFAYEEAYASTHSDLPVRLFMTAGGLEVDLLEPFNQMAEHLQSRAYPGLDLSTYVFEGEGHTSVMAASISRALCWLYYDNLIKD